MERKTYLREDIGLRKFGGGVTDLEVVVLYCPLFSILFYQRSVMRGAFCCPAIGHSYQMLRFCAIISAVTYALRGSDLLL